MTSLSALTKVENAASTATSRFSAAAPSIPTIGSPAGLGGRCSRQHGRWRVFCIWRVFCKQKPSVDPIWHPRACGPIVVVSDVKRGALVDSGAGVRPALVAAEPRGDQKKCADGGFQ